MSQVVIVRICCFRAITDRPYIACGSCGRMVLRAITDRPYIACGSCGRLVLRAITDRPYIIGSLQHLRSYHKICDRPINYVIFDCGRMIFRVDFLQANINLWSKDRHYIIDIYILQDYHLYISIFVDIPHHF